MATTGARRGMARSPTRVTGFAPVNARGPDAYTPPAGIHDEAIDPHGALRADSAVALALLDGRDLESLALGVRAHSQRAGCVFHSADGDAVFEVDPVPRVIGAAEWEHLVAGLTQRVRALNAFVADVYGPRRAVREGVLPARVIEGADHYEPRMRGTRVPHDQWIGVAGLDLVRDPAGELLVLEDNCMTPSGFAYAQTAREAVLEHLAPPPGARPLPLDGLGDGLRATLAHAAPAGAHAPRMVVLTDGPQNSAHYEHTRAAALLGVPLVEPHQLTQRGTRLLHDGAPVDVVYRRTDNDLLDTPVGRLLGPPHRAGSLGIVNAFGTGVADDKLAHAYVEALVRFFCGEEPLLRSVPTYDLARPEDLERTLDELERLVVKPRAGHGGIGVLIGPLAEGAELDEARDAIRSHPDQFVAQPLIAFSTHPTVVDGELVPRHVDLRPFVFMRGDGDAWVLPGGLTRVAFGEGAIVVNSTQNGGGKDTWVLAPETGR